MSVVASRAPRSASRPFAIAFCVYAIASLVHFAHNAEFLAQYPNLPSSWTRAGVYLAWLGIMAVGVAGWVLVARGFKVAGLMLVALYAILGLDSLGHYVVAPLSAHTLAMNATILLEVGTAAVLLAVIIACAAREVLQGRRR